MQVNPLSEEMTAQDAQIALEFLNRVDLKGAEAEAMAILKAKLRKIVQPSPETARQTAPPEGGEGGNVHELTGAKGEGSALA